MKQSKPPPGEVRATVTNITGPGSGRYVVTFPDWGERIPMNKSVTFSLREWEGEREPTPGQTVILSQIEEFARGWRARRARPVMFNQQEQKE